MNERRAPRGVPIAEGFFHTIAGFVGGFSLLPRGIALVADPDRRRPRAGAHRGMPPARTTIWPLLLAFVLVVAAAPAWAAASGTLPAGVPNIYDPNVLARFRPFKVGSLLGNADFPVVLLVSAAGEEPEALLVGLDARNGKDTWSLAADPTILLVLLSDSRTIREVFVDAGFVGQGRASGNYAAVERDSLAALPELLQAVTAPAEGSRRGNEPPDAAPAAERARVVPSVQAGGRPRTCAITA